MPNAISPEKTTYTFLESREVLEWMAKMARARGTDLSVIMREATSAYYVQHRSGDSPENSLFAARSRTKAAQRARTARQIADGELTREAAQQRNAPIREAVHVVDLWPAILRRARANT